MEPKTTQLFLPFLVSLVRHLLVVIVTRLGIEQDPDQLQHASMWAGNILIALAMSAMAAWSAWSMRKAKNELPPDVTFVRTSDGRGITVPMVFIAAGLLLGAGLQGGCSTMSESQQFAQSSTLYTDALRTITPMIDAQLLSAEDVRTFEIARYPAGKLLDQWEDALISHQPFTGRAALDALLDQLINLQQKEQADDAPRNSGADEVGNAGVRPRNQAVGRVPGRDARTVAGGNQGYRRLSTRLRGDVRRGRQTGRRRCGLDRPAFVT